MWFYAGSMFGATFDGVQGNPSPRFLFPVAIICMVSMASRPLLHLAIAKVGLGISPNNSIRIEVTYHPVEGHDCQK